MSSTQKFSRRQLLKRASAAGAAIAVPWIVPSSVFGANAPSNRIVMGSIGVGGMGTGNTLNFLGMGDVQLVAVCDVDRRHREHMKHEIDGKYGNKDCRTYLDFREMLEKEKLDALTTALPDHWHAIPVIAAARKRIDIYGEKPLARSIKEGRAMCDAVQACGCVWQTGSWQRSSGDFRRAAELVINGRIGKVSRAIVGLPGGTAGRPYPPVQAPPPYLDWNLWLGPAPWRPYSAFGGDDGPHGDWRWIMDYSGGQLTDWAGHHIDIAHWGLGFDHTGPVEIAGSAVYPEDGIYDVPGDYHFECTYANGVVIDVSNANRMGTTWHGDKGWVYVDRDGFDAEPKSLLKEVIGTDEIKLYESDDHHRNFIECVKSRKLTITPIETAYRSISVGLLGEIAMLTGRKIRWNPDTEEILADPAASALLGRAYRAPWSL